MEAEQKNFDFAFLFDLKSSEHLYYRWVMLMTRCAHRSYIWVSKLAFPYTALLVLPLAAR